MIDDRMKLRATQDYDYYAGMIPKCVNGMLAEPIFDQLSDSLYS